MDILTLINTEDKSCEDVMEKSCHLHQYIYFLEEFLKTSLNQFPCEVVNQTLFSSRGNRFLPKQL